MKSKGGRLKEGKKEKPERTFSQSRRQLQPSRLVTISNAKAGKSTANLRKTCEWPSTVPFALKDGAGNSLGKIQYTVVRGCENHLLTMIML